MAEDCGSFAPGILVDWRKIAGSMEAAVVDQGYDAEQSTVALDPVADDGAVLIAYHGDGLLQGRGAHLIAEPGEGISPESLQVREALGMDRSGVLMIGQSEFAQLLVQAGEEQSLPCRRLGGCHQKAVIGSGVAAVCGR